MFDKFRSVIDYGAALTALGVCMSASLAQGLDFRDGFEGDAFDPFWSVHEQSGAAARCNARTHTGDQAACLSTVVSGDSKSVALEHRFAGAVYGRVSVWMYDTGADRSSSNYIYLTLYDSTTNHLAEIGTMDYDLGPNNGGNYLYHPWWVWGPAPLNSPIDRTQSWHQWVIDSRPDYCEISIDDVVLYQSDAGQSFDLVSLWIGGPNWRPAWNAYFDDFAFTEFRVAPPPCETSLALNWSNTGYPSSAASDHGWGGGAHPEHINDGAKAYQSWTNGLAFTGGNNHWGGEPCGWRYAVIDFGAPTTFKKIVIWHHGEEHVPAEAVVEIWDGQAWSPVVAQRTYGRVSVLGSGSGNSTSDEYLLPEVTASKVRYGFDNCGLNILGVPITHGWIYEFDVFSYDTDPLCGGELNNDGYVNNFDIDAFVLALSDPNSFHIAYPAANFYNADINQDGFINNFDVDALVAILAN